MPQLYTPFLTQAGAAIGRGMEKRGIAQQKEEQNRLAGQAYMGDPRAMEELMQINPQMGAKILQETRKRKETEEQRTLEKRTLVKKEIDILSEQVAKFDTYEEAKKYADPIVSDILTRYPEVAPKAGIDAGFSKEGYEQARQIYGDGTGGAYIGKGMEAQVSNMLTKGAEDPEFRNTPEYARAWQLASEPKVIRTPTGDILLRPELSAVFKPPGAVKTDKQQIKESKDAVKRDIEVIPGTKKELKTTADEKVSTGYYNRMIEDEKNIEKLGDFDSTGYWERFKGITNIGASPELQQYRQAADDWIRAKLRRESGAVIAEEEMEKEYEVYFPQIGDSQAVMDQKKAGRQKAVAAMKIAGGMELKKYLKNGGEITPTGKTATNPQTGAKLREMSDGSWESM